MEQGFKFQATINEVSIYILVVYISESREAVWWLWLPKTCALMEISKIEQYSVHNRTYKHICTRICIIMLTSCWPQSIKMLPHEATYIYIYMYMSLEIYTPTKFFLGGHSFSAQIHYSMSYVEAKVSDHHIAIGKMNGVVMAILLLCIKKKHQGSICA